jgi:hypothetical protein
LARELGVDLSNVTGTGQKGRVLDTDLKGYVKQFVNIDLIKLCDMWNIEPAGS